MRAASGKVKVAQAEEQRLAALVGYTKIVAPYDGRVVVRNANTGDFLQIGGGRPVGDPGQPGDGGHPIYVVARTDKVRVFVDVPEIDADYVNEGTKARVRIQAFSGAEIDATLRARPGRSASRRGPCGPRSTCPTRTRGCCRACTLMAWW